MEEIIAVVLNNEGSIGAKAHGQMSMEVIDEKQAGRKKATHGFGGADYRRRKRV